nr:hypothetical protein BV025_00723 [Haemophilus influenzae]
MVIQIDAEYYYDNKSLVQQMNALSVQFRQNYLFQLIHLRDLKLIRVLTLLAVSHLVALRPLNKEHFVTIVDSCQVVLTVAHAKELADEMKVVLYPQGSLN